MKSFIGNKVYVEKQRDYWWDSKICRKWNKLWL